MCAPMAVAHLMNGSHLSETNKREPESAPESTAFGWEISATVSPSAVEFGNLEETMDPATVFTLG